MKRPLSISIIGGIYVFASLLCFFIIVNTYRLTCRLLSKLTVTQLYTMLSLEQIFLLALAFVCFLLVVVFAIGFFKGWNWVRWLYVFSGGLMYILTFTGVLGKISFSDILSFVFFIVILYFLFTPKANAWFSEKDSPENLPQPPLETRE